MTSPSAAWTDLGEGVLVRQSRAYRMNSVVLAREGNALVIDAGVLPSELDDIAARVSALAPRFEQVTLAFTHPHWDHVLGRPWWPQAGTVGHAGLGAELRRDAGAILAEATEHATRFGETWSQGFQPFEPDLVVKDGSVRSSDERATVLGPWYTAPPKRKAAESFP